MEKIPDPVARLKYYVDFTYIFANEDDNYVFWAGSSYRGTQKSRIKESINDFIEFNIDKVNSAIKAGQEAELFKKHADASLFSRSFITFLWGILICYDTNAEDEFLSVKHAFMELMLKELLNTEAS